MTDQEIDRIATGFANTAMRSAIVYCERNGNDLRTATADEIVSLSAILKAGSGTALDAAMTDMREAQHMGASILSAILSTSAAAFGIASAKTFLAGRA